MTYNKKELLKMLEAAPLYDGIVFHEGKNAEFMKCMGTDFCDHYFYKYGASKLALIPFDNKDFVIKIPYTGTCYEYSGDSENANSGVYEDFYHAEYEDRPWDYCAVEVMRYQIAQEDGFERYLAKTELLGFINNYPIYVQERGVIYPEALCVHNYSIAEKEETSKICSGIWCNINPNWLTDFRICYGKKQLFDFLCFLQSMGWDDDLRVENIGYINNYPVLIDYSGFFE